MHRTPQCKGNCAPRFVQYTENIINFIVNPLCYDASYDSCGASSFAPDAEQHPPGKPTNQAQFWLSCRPCYKKGGSLANGTNHCRTMYLIVYVGSLLLSTLLFQVRHHSPTLQFCAKLRFDHQTVADWSQFCCRQRGTSF